MLPCDIDDSKFIFVKAYFESYVLALIISIIICNGSFSLGVNADVAADVQAQSSTDVLGNNGDGFYSSSSLDIGFMAAFGLLAENE